MFRRHTAYRRARTEVPTYSYRYRHVTDTLCILICTLTLHLECAEALLAKKLSTEEEMGFSSLLLVLVQVALTASFTLKGSNLLQRGCNTARQMLTRDEPISIASLETSEINRVISALPVTAALFLAVTAGSANAAEATPSEVEDPLEKITNKVFFDITVNGQEKGRIVIGLFN